MELLDRYLQAVRFWLPKAQQQDIIAELSTDLHSQIDDKEAEVGRPLNNAELEVILRRCGAPILVASRFRPQTQLIGPALFPIYGFVLKAVLLWILVPVFIVIVGPAMIVPAANRWAEFFEVWGTLSNAMFVAAAVITLIFAVLERTQAKLQLFDKWSLQSLPQAPKVERPPSRTQTVFELICGIGGLLYLLAIPYAPFLILGPAAAFLKPAPMWHSFYLPLILLSLVGLANQCATLARPQWTWLAPSGRLLTTFFSLIVVNSMINVAGQAPNGEWHPFVMVSNPHASVKLNHVAAYVNLSVLLTLAVTWFGLAIAVIVQAWVLLRHLRKRTAQARDPALRML